MGSIPAGAGELTFGRKRAKAGRGGCKPLAGGFDSYYSHATQNGFTLRSTKSVTGLVNPDDYALVA